MNTPADFPRDYPQRVYAGVLGKIIGVYVGRPFEGWSHREVLAKLGEVDGYVNEKLGAPLVVTDDDISGTFTFLRALEDYNDPKRITPKQIGQTWLNYLIEGKTVLWWGGMGMSTEHTAFLRLKHGIDAPGSGSIATNGQVVAEQIGAQIFIDGWGLINPGDPERAADFARRAASVSHDGEAVYCAQVVAAMVAQAFVESRVDRLIDSAVALIPPDCLTRQLIDDVREWHAKGLDWRSGFAEIEARYGYDKYGGNCHVIPNHTVVIHALLHGAGDFGRSLMVANSCGWDTDCNSGNVGCVVGVLSGLAAIDAGYDWRGPVADKIYLPTADGGRCVTDAVAETYRIIGYARALSDQAFAAPKRGARFHFSLPGSVQGFEGMNCRLSNVQLPGSQFERALAVEFKPTGGKPIRVVTETFPTPAARRIGGYELVASPTLYPGQTVRARIVAGPANEGPLRIGLTVSRYDGRDELIPVSGPSVSVAAGEVDELSWRLPDMGGYPIAEVGIEVVEAGKGGTVYLDWLTWSGSPDTVFRRTEGSSWKAAWVNAVSEHASWGEAFRVVQNEGVGLLTIGCREWTDYWVSAKVTPHLAIRAGIAARVQGLKRYYALLLVRGGGIQLVRALDREQTLAEAPYEWELGETHELSLAVSGAEVTGFANGNEIFRVLDSDRPLTGGGVALVIEEGRMGTNEVVVRPV